MIGSVIKKYDSFIKLDIYLIYYLIIYYIFHYFALDI